MKLKDSFMKRNLRILLVVSNFDNGGAQKQVALLLNALSKVEGVTVQLVTSSYGVNARFLHPDSAVVQIKRKSGFDIRFAFRLSRHIQDFKPDIVYSWLQSSDVQVFLAKLISKSRFKWVVAERDSAYPRTFRFYLREKLAMFSDAIIANSNAGTEYWKSKNYTKYCTSVDNILHIPFFDKSEKNSILFVGRFEKQKQVLKVAEAFVLVKKNLPECKVYIVGDGSLVSEVNALVAGTGVIVLPYQENVYKLYAQAEVFVNFSLHEGTPNTVIENLALGNTVVLSDIQEHRDLVGADYPFLLNVDADVGHIADMIIRAVDSDFSDDFGASVRARFSEITSVQNHLRIFELLSV